ncbi:Glu/Leu/Phe/Val dehydrogenase [Nocardioides sp. Y6]|uniref:Glu/Leu/Phe/Val dehydrogenase n=1 Tax=Nocardioides malaquae TaxID=2773426 RepID=A0ABR9RWA4_9ACTN|nr:Glu/Leu/Phe/Val dehydrogenase [Nocardioides malaquae]MBE7325871.1 Glu/Leu/Phe/Val dehydrogenase [Nocardioides malaquae]
MTDGSVDPFTSDHEQVVFAHDPESGLRAIIALHSTALGPGLGGTRFHPYASTADALRDVLALSRGMTYKNALAGLDLGGGKAVIIGDPRQDKSEALLRAYGRFVESLGGRYVTACDVGTFSEDMDVVARESRHVTGRTPEHGGAGDSSVLTAYGVHQGMRACSAHLWGTESLEGRVVGVSGVGKVGVHLVGHLVDEGAKVIVTDVWEPSLDRIRDLHPEVGVASSTESMLAGEAGDLEIYAPCALGGAVTAEVARTTGARIICGAANNQLADDDVARVLTERGVLHAPDFVVNAGGVIQVADEREGFDFERARRRAHRIGATTLEVLEQAHREGVTTTEAAERLAERRIHDVARLRRIHLRNG